ncbi:GldG family protein [Methylococcus capsulatus]|uniref:GldG family protein n=1 Tax=Methylococcus capsulatus TaxID=414 RepID=UPI001C533C2F|nr:Gldg family protein [Methylococcus capsulatus]QXP87754.1 Gldg family protein [Methylococcus capsulatus]UQN12767.1 Gldg family protein [Methylococcus capsulatus]
MTLNRKTLSGSALAVLAVLFVSLTLISNALFRGVRLDLTENSLYTLSDGSRNILAKLDEPIHLRLYFSDKATAESNRPDVRGLRLYFDRVREMLEEMRSRAGGKIELEVIDPLPYSEAEDRAAAAGLQGIPLGPSGEKVFLGLEGSNSTDGRATIPFFEPGKEAFLEYDLVKLVHDLATPKKPVVGLVSSLPLAGGFDPQRGDMGAPWTVYEQLSQSFDVRSLDADSLKAVAPEIEVLVVVHPKRLGEDAQYALDQFVLRGGRLMVFVDPHAENDGVGDPRDPMAAMVTPKASDLPVLFKAWGVEYKPDEAVLDRARAVTVNTAPGAPPSRHPAIMRLGKPDLNAADVITANLDTIHLASVGHFRPTTDGGSRLTPLLQTSDQAMVVPADRIRFLGDPSSLLQDYKPGGERLIVAGRLEGKFKTAFPQRGDPGHLAEAKGTGEILLIADTDLLSDRLWVRSSNFFGRKLLTTFAGNGDLFVNAVDNLAGSSDLISIRGRGTSARPFTKVEELKAAADDRFRSKERELQQELGETERKLAELQRGKTGDDTFVLSPAQRKELDDFLRRKLEIRKELREVRRQLDADIDALGAQLKFIDIALVPLLLTLGTLGFIAWNARREKA